VFIHTEGLSAAREFKHPTIHSTIKEGLISYVKAKRLRGDVKESWEWG
jgi:hypothetical protein